MDHPSLDISYSGPTNYFSITFLSFLSVVPIPVLTYNQVFRIEKPDVSDTGTHHNNIGMDKCRKTDRRQAVKKWFRYPVPLLALAMLTGARGGALSQFHWGL
jgi:hypothetical protein